MKIRKTIVLTAGGSMLLALAYAVAMANCNGCVPAGSELSCTMSTCSASITTSTGPGTFTTTPTTQPTFKVVGSQAGNDGQVASTSLQPLAWKGSGNSPTLGEVHWEFDLSRPVENTTVNSDQLGADFPAIVHIRIHIRGTIDAYPGVTFQSVTPLDITGMVNSFAPFNEATTLHLAAPVQFQDADDTTGPSFTMTDLTLTFSGTD